MIAMNSRARPSEVLLTWKVSGRIELSITSVRQKAMVSNTTSLPYIEDSTTHMCVLERDRDRA